MSILDLCERIQETWLSRTIGGSTWGYPVVGALHVLAIAMFGGAVLIPHVDVELRRIRSMGMALVILTGVALFASGATRYYESASFRIKLVLLVLVGFNTIAYRTAAGGQRRRKLHSAIGLALWVAVIFAARGIAFF